MTVQRLYEIVKPVAIEAPAYKTRSEQKDFLHWLENERTSTSITLYGSAYGSGSILVHSVLIPSKDLIGVKPEAMNSWEGSPFDSPSCGLVYGGEKGARVELTEPWSDRCSKALKQRRQLVFGRSFEGRLRDKTYFELAQELTLAHKIHWTEERNAWCRLDDAGDIVDIAKVEKIGGEGGRGSAIWVSINRELLEMHMAATNTCLVQMFDSTYIPERFQEFDGGEENIISDVDGGLYYKFRIDLHGASYFRGVQIIHPVLDASELGKAMYAADNAPKEYVSFLTQDFKNGRIVNVSCAPSSLASYFDKGSSLPFQTSPVFFKPSVLDKYKADPEKYSIRERGIDCRNSWSLSTYDVNEADQVHTMIKYLGDLPYSEQLYWKSFNEAPKASISRRSFKTDFEGSFDDEQDGLRDLKSTLYRLHELKSEWFVLHEPGLVDQLHYPLTESSKVWNDTLISLAKCVAEGLRKTYFESQAKKLGRCGEAQWGSIRWTRELLDAMSVDSDRISEIVDPLTKLQHLRSKLGAHSGGAEAVQIRRDLLKQFRTPKAHVYELASQLGHSLESLSSILETQPK